MRLAGKEGAGPDHLAPEISHGITFGGFFGANGQRA
jgi:hypothetical protein